MDTREIERMKKRSVRISLLAVAVVMLFLGGLIFAGQILSVRYQINSTLSYIVSQEGKAQSSGSSSSAAAADTDLANDRLKRLSKPFFGFNPFYLDRLRTAPYFTVTRSSDGKISLWMSRDGLIGKTNAKELAEKLLKAGKSKGRYDFYFYQIRRQKDGGWFIACIDYQEGIYNLLRLLVWWFAALAAGLLLTWLISRSLADRMVRPMVENSRRQSQFITNASHELKTPIAVIRSNTELLEMTSGPTPWTTSTLQQVDRLSALIQDLVLIARSQEQETGRTAVDTDISQAVTEAAAPFRSVAETRQEALLLNITPNIRLTADGDSIRTLTSVLMDNALKYCDPGGQVSLTLAPGRQAGAAALTVSNDFAGGAGADLPRFFERFYRADQAHHAEAGDQTGFGIGLSLAQNIASLYGGELTCDWRDGVISFRCQLHSLEPKK